MSDTLRFYELAKLGDSDNENRLVIDTFIEEVEDEIWRLLKGEPIASMWPEGARIQLTGREEGLEMGDFIANTENVIIASAAFVAVIRRLCEGVPVEYLPVSIHDRRKRRMGEEFFVVNPLGTHDCIDLEKSAVSWDEGPPREVLLIREITIDAKKGAKAPQLFRPAGAPSRYIMRYDLAKATKDAGLENVLWTKLEVGS